MSADNFTIVLVEPEFPVNLGSVCRAMKNFDFFQLALVNPKCGRGLEARKYAKHSEDVLDNAKIAKSLKEAVKGFDLVVGTTGVAGRFRKKQFKNCLALEEFAEKAGAGKKTALVFGRESSGLTEKEVDQCDLVITIPTGSAHKVLNLSHAVAIVLYELHCRLAGKKELFRVAARKKRERLEKLFEKIVARTETVRDRKKVGLAFKRVLERAMVGDDEAQALFAVFGELAKDWKPNRKK